MSTRTIDYSKWDRLTYSSSSEEEEKEVKKTSISRALANLSLPSPLWTGLVTHHRDIFVSHVLPKLNKTDRYFFSKANAESLDLLKYAGLNASEIILIVEQCSSISTLEWAWNNFKSGGIFDEGTVMDQARFCARVAATNKLEFLKWAREEKKCEWDQKTITIPALVDNLEMLKYCFANGCPYDEKKACIQAAREGHLDCLRFLLEKVKPSPETEKKAAALAAQYGQLDVLKYLFEERKMSLEVKYDFMSWSARDGHFDCLKYIVEEAKVPLIHCLPFAYARYYEQSECLHYLREKGCPEPTDAQYATFVAIEQQRSE